MISRTVKFNYWYFTKGEFPSDNFPRVFSQVATSQMCNFPKVRLGHLRYRKLQLGGGSTAALLLFREPNAADKTGYGAKRCRLGKLPFRKLHSWEVATWENTHGKLPVGKKAFRKVRIRAEQNIYIIKTKSMGVQLRK